MPNSLYNSNQRILAVPSDKLIIKSSKCKGWNLNKSKNNGVESTIDNKIGRAHV